jgi:N-acetylglucosamine-6-phosphate deacetylase
LFVAEGSIQAVDPSVPPLDCQVVDGQGKLLTPGLIDVHTHGIHEFQYEANADSLRAGAKALARYGTTTAIPTLVPQKGPDMLEHIRVIADALPSVTGACMPGIHMEGPFMALAGAACPTMAGDLKVLDDIIAACRNRLMIMSISPEQENIIPVIERLRERGATVFMTHTRASAVQTQRAIDAGVTHATHFYDVFPIPEVTEPGVRPVGVVETVLANRRVSVDFIPDGVHVDPMAIRACFAAKGWRGVMGITDSNIGAGLEPGEYDTPWGFRVRVRQNDAARIVGNNFLAGSALTLNVGIRNLMTWLDVPPEQAWAMGTINQARLLGLAKKGTLAVGADADIVIWNEDLTPVKTWVGGELVYTA